MYKRHFSDCSLTVPKVKLVTYLKEDIPVLGCLHADVSLNDKVTPACLYIVKGGTALMGMDLIRALNCSSHQSENLFTLMPCLHLTECTQLLVKPLLLQILQWAA